MEYQHLACGCHSSGGELCTGAMVPDDREFIWGDGRSNDDSRWSEMVITGDPAGWNWPGSLRVVLNDCTVHHHGYLANRPTPSTFHHEWNDRVAVGGPSYWPLTDPECLVQFNIGVFSRYKNFDHLTRSAHEQLTRKHNVFNGRRCRQRRKSSIGIVPREIMRRWGRNHQWTRNRCVRLRRRGASQDHHDLCPDVHHRPFMHLLFRLCWHHDLKPRADCRSTAPAADNHFVALHLTKVSWPSRFPEKIER